LWLCPEGMSEKCQATAYSHKPLTPSAFLAGALSGNGCWSVCKCDGSMRQASRLRQGAATTATAAVLQRCAHVAESCLRRCGVEGGAGQECVHGEPRDAGWLGTTGKWDWWLPGSRALAVPDSSGQRTVLGAGSHASIRMALVPTSGGRCLPALLTSACSFHSWLSCVPSSQPLSLSACSSSPYSWSASSSS